MNTSFRGHIQSITVRNYTDRGKGFRCPAAKKKTNIRCTSIAIGAFISSNNEINDFKARVGYAESNKWSSSSLREIS